jgi:DNA-binding NarL/FixJ family response regulator
MARQVEALVVDDDLWSLRMMKGLLRECFPQMQVHVRSEPDCSGDYNIYFLDNDFDGCRVAARFASEIRARRPDALIIAYSANLDADTLKSLINAGCNGACDKSQPGDLPQTMEITRAYVESLMAPASRSTPTGVIHTLRSAKDLLREWNSRLDREEQLAAAGGER